MQIRDLVKSIDKMTTEELLEHVRGMRHRRETLRPVAAKKAEKAEKKAGVARVKKTNDLLEGMTPEELAKLAAMLTQE